MRFFKTFDEIQPGDVGIDLSNNLFFTVIDKSRVLDWKERLQQYDDGESMKMILDNPGLLWEEGDIDYDQPLLAIKGADTRVIPFGKFPHQVYRFQPLVKSVRWAVMTLLTTLLLIVGIACLALMIILAGISLTGIVFVLALTVALTPLALLYSGIKRIGQSYKAKTIF